MKFARDQYSKIFLAFKAGALAPLLSILKVSIDGDYFFAIPADLKGDVSVLLSGVCIFLVDLLFNFFVVMINDFEISRGIKRIDQDIYRLEGCLKGNTDRKYEIDVKRKIKKLRIEKADLIVK